LQQRWLRVAVPGSSCGKRGRSLVSKSSLTIRVAFILTLALAVLMMLLVHVAPPELVTLSAMEVLKQRIARYAQQNDALPARLCETPEIAGKADATSDGWGREIAYSVDEDGVVTLTSLGRDGEPGGTGDAADIVRRFRAKDADGVWMDEFCEWLEHGRPQ
jgi:hypothetical protein